MENAVALRPFLEVVDGSVVFHFSGGDVEAQQDDDCSRWFREGLKEKDPGSPALHLGPAFRHCFLNILRGHSV